MKTYLVPGLDLLRAFSKERAGAENDTDEAAEFCSVCGEV